MADDKNRTDRPTEDQRRAAERDRKVDAAARALLKNRQRPPRSRV